MKKPLTLAVFALFLSACSGPGTDNATIEDALKNPLFAERYYEDMMQHMVNLVINNDPLTKDPETMEIVDDLRNDSLNKAQEANARQAQGLSGIVISNDEYAFGEMLLLNNTLYVSPDFTVAPGPALHMYLTTVIDPHDETFPDETALALGPLKNPYGIQSYEVPASDAETQPAYATAVIWDETFKRVYGFVQLRKR